MAITNRSQAGTQGGRHAATTEGDADTPTLTVSREKVCEIVFKAREFDVKDVVSVPDDGSDPVDDEERGVLEDRSDDPVARELGAFINAMNFDEQVDLVTLMWLGRGDGTLADWAELRDTACGEHNRFTARYLLGTPLLADYLSEGLALFGYSCEEFADEH
jgi:Protein of unknown function (DUF3775)